MDTQEEHGLPTLHNVFNSILTRESSDLLTIGAICSVIFKKNGLYIFLFLILMDKMDTHQEMVLHFDMFLDDLVICLYNFYDNIKIDMSLQFDVLQINVRMSEKRTEL